MGAESSNKLFGLNVVTATAGGMHSAAVTAAGALFTWGCGDDNCLGRPLPGMCAYIKFWLTALFALVDTFLSILFMCQFTAMIKEGRKKLISFKGDS